MAVLSYEVREVLYLHGRVDEAGSIHGQLYATVGRPEILCLLRVDPTGDPTHRNRYQVGTPKENDMKKMLTLSRPFSILRI